MKNRIRSIISGQVPRPLAVPAWPGVARYAKLGIPFLLAFALLVCLIAPAWCATDMTVSRPNAGAGPTPVNVYLYLVDVFEVSGSDQAFNADVVLIAEWRDPNLAGKWTAIQSAKLEDVWEPRLQVVNQRGGAPYCRSGSRSIPRGWFATGSAGRDVSRPAWTLGISPWIGSVFTSRS